MGVALLLPVAAIAAMIALWVFLWALYGLLWVMMQTQKQLPSVLIFIRWITACTWAAVTRKPRCVICRSWTQSLLLTEFDDADLLCFKHTERWRRIRQLEAEVPMIDYW